MEGSNDKVGESGHYDWELHSQHNKLDLKALTNKDE